MIPFFPKFGSEEDAPGYGPSGSEDRCETCAHYRDLGNKGYCEKFSFLCNPEYVCDDYRPAGTIKESQAIEKSVELTRSAAKKIEKDVIPETRHAKNIAALRAFFAKEKTASVKDRLKSLARHSRE